ncbi:MAG: peptidase M28, partial [Bacteroidota bacterium]
MRNLIYTLLISCLFTSLIQAQNLSDSLQNLRVDLVYLASDLLEGREPGTQGEALAAQYITYRFETMGLSPFGIDSTWYQPFTFKFHANPHESEENKDQ